MHDGTDSAANDRLTYYTILYERAVVALSMYEANSGSIDKSVIENQRHTVNQTKRQLEAFKKAMEIGEWDEV